MVSYNSVEYSGGTPIRLARNYINRIIITQGFNHTGAAFHLPSVRDTSSNSQNAVVGMEIEIWDDNSELATIGLPIKIQQNDPATVTINGISGAVGITQTTGSTKRITIRYDGSGMWVVYDGFGPRGPQGAQGTGGGRGAQGLQGNQGNQGNQGSQGVQGLQGNQGNQGAQGTVGNQGAQGVQGLQGNQGAQGTVGNQGAQGVQGLQGNQGAQGVQGLQGNQGVQGLQGLQGAQGVQGLQGAQGNRGPQGNQGNQGAQGVQGITGPGFKYDRTVWVDPLGDDSTGVIGKPEFPYLTINKAVDALNAAAIDGGNVIVMSGYYELLNTIKFDIKNRNTTLQLNGNCLIQSRKDMTDPMITVDKGGSFNIVGDDLNSKTTPWNISGIGSLISGSYNTGALFETNGGQCFLSDYAGNAGEENGNIGTYYSFHNITIWANPKNEIESKSIFDITKPDTGSFQLSLTNCSVIDSRENLLDGLYPMIYIKAQSDEDFRRLSSTLILRDTFFFKEGNTVLEENGRDSFIYADHERNKKPSNWLISNCIFYHTNGALGGSSTGCIVTKIPVNRSLRTAPWLSIRMNNNEFNWELRNSGGTPYILYDLNNDPNSVNSIVVINKGSSIASCRTTDNTIPIVTTQPNLVGAPSLFGPITLDIPYTINRS